MWSVFIPKEESTAVIYGFIAVCPLLCVSVILRSSARVSVCVGARVSLTSENCFIIKNLVSDSAFFLIFSLLVSLFWLFH